MRIAINKLEVISYNEKDIVNCNFYYYVDGFDNNCICGRETVYTKIDNVLGESGYVVRDQLVTLTRQSRSWNEHTGNNSRVISDYTDDDGRVVLTLAHNLQSPNDLPTALGEEVCYRDGAIKFMDYYDIDGISITAGNAPAYTTVVYHLMRSDYVGS